MTPLMTSSLPCRVEHYKYRSFFLFCEFCNGSVTHVPRIFGTARTAVVRNPNRCWWSARWDQVMQGTT